MKIRIVLKSGYSFTMECEGFEMLTSAYTADMLSFDLINPKGDDNILFLNEEEIALIIKEDE